MVKFMFFAEKNKGYSWFNYKNTYFKGYIIMDNSDTVLRGVEAALYFEEKVNNKEDFREILSGIDGSFCVVKVTPSALFGAVDRARSMPLYFNEECASASDSSEQLRQILHIDSNDVDALRIIEFMESDYVDYDRTVYSRIKQLDAGQMFEINTDGTDVDYYYRHIHSIINKNKNEALEELYKISLTVFSKVKKIIAGRPVVLSLSGGYDSRYIATMLKLVGVENVKCYTYGKKDSFEIKQSKSVADALGYQWKCVEYTDELIEDAVNDFGYYDYCNEHDYTIYLQNYAAVKQLENDGWFEANSVFITGLCGDMPTGNYVRGENKEKEYSLDSVANDLVESRYKRNRLSIETKKRFIHEYYDRCKNIGIDVNDYQSYVQVFDCISTCGQHSRCFLQMNRVHEYMGYEWLLPYWSKELLDYWYSLPYIYRVRQCLYEDFIVNILCSQFGIGTKKYRASYGKNRLINKVKHLGGAVLVRVLFIMNKPFRRKYDYNNFSYGEYLLFSKLRNKKRFNYQKAGFPYILNRYIIERRGYI